MDEDPLQRRIYFLTFVESIDMIFSQYTETCEVLLDYPKIGGDDVIEDYTKKAIRNFLHANIDVHSRRLIAEFPKDGIKCIEKLQSHCANMTFADKIRYDITFQQVTQMTRQTHLRATTLTLPMTVIIDAGEAKIRNIGKGSNH